MKTQRRKVEPIRNPTLFEIEKLEEMGKLANTVTGDRPFSLPGILLGTSAFTAAGWEGTFYAAHAPATAELSWDLWNMKEIELCFRAQLPATRLTRVTGHGKAPWLLPPLLLSCI